MRTLLFFLGFLPLFVEADDQLLVVYHIATASERRQHIALRNLENYFLELEEQGEQATVKVLLEGDGVSLLNKAIENPYLQQRILGLHRDGAQFVVGRESVERRGFDLERDLLTQPVYQVVDNGILALVNLQQQGYAYTPYLAR